MRTHSYEFSRKGMYGMHVVIFAGGTLRPGKAVQAAIASADFVIAADSGATSALQQGCTPAIIVGDFDSLDALTAQQLQEQGSRTVPVHAEKDETDTELAIQTAIEQGATSITILGWLGGARFDHTMANILLLAGFETVPIRLVDGPSVCWLMRGPGRASIDGQVDDVLTPVASPVSGSSESKSSNCPSILARPGPRMSQQTEGPSTSRMGTVSKPASSKIFAMVWSKRAPPSQPSIV